MQVAINAEPTRCIDDVCITIMLFEYLASFFWSVFRLEAISRPLVGRSFQAAGGLGSPPYGNFRSVGALPAWF